MFCFCSPMEPAMSSDWGEDLIRSYPNIFGSAGSNPAHPRVGDGWRSLVGLTIRRLSYAVAAHPKAVLRITSIEQKYGSLRIHYSGSGIPAAAVDAIENALTMAEAVSEHTCEMCGAPGRLFDDRGMLGARCRVHSSGRPVVDIPEHD